jgi:tRNA(Ile)-lysidine synthase
MAHDADQKIDAFLETIRGKLAGKTVIAAVSGGSDSVALLALLHQRTARFGFSLRAVTINHRIRDDEESLGDALFVKDLCASLDPPVPCELVNLAHGEVAALAKNRGRGIEEAARFLRYRVLESSSFAGDALVMTAHNRNDRDETTLMRFFQGAQGISLSGILPFRGRFIRPLLECSHEELRSFLRDRGMIWREDSTNGDDRYLRNRIRLRLVPVLDRYIPGWSTGMGSGAAKAALDEDLARSLVSAKWLSSGSFVTCPAADWFSMHPAVRLRFLRDGLSLLSSASPGVLPSRVAGGYLLDVCCLSPSPAGGKCAGSGLLFRFDGTSVFWGPDIVQNTKSGYLVCIRRSGKYSLPSGEISVTGSENLVYINGRIGPFSLPLVVRSRSGGDTVRTGSGGRKTLKKLMNDWSVPEELRNLVPLVEQEGQIRAVCGSLLGYPDWFVQT